MLCVCCGSSNLPKFKGEIALRLPGANAIEPTVFVWPEVAVCLSCGVAQFSVPNAELRVLAKGAPVAGYWHD